MPMILSSVDFPAPEGPMMVTNSPGWMSDRKSTRLNSSHGYISYAVFCLKKKKNQYGKLRRCHNRMKSNFRDAGEQLNIYVMRQGRAPVEILSDPSHKRCMHISDDRSAEM